MIQTSWNNGLVRRVSCWYRVKKLNLLKPCAYTRFMLKSFLFKNRDFDGNCIIVEPT